MTAQLAILALSLILLAAGLALVCWSARTERQWKLDDRRRTTRMAHRTEADRRAKTLGDN